MIARGGRYGFRPETCCRRHSEVFMAQTGHIIRSGQASPGSIRKYRQNHLFIIWSDKL